MASKTEKRLRDLGWGKEEAAWRAKVIDASNVPTDPEAAYRGMSAVCETERGDEIMDWDANGVARCAHPAVKPYPGYVRRVLSRPFRWLGFCDRDSRCNVVGYLEDGRAIVAIGAHNSGDSRVQVGETIYPDVTGAVIAETPRT